MRLYLLKAAVQLISKFSYARFLMPDILESLAKGAQSLFHKPFWIIFILECPIPVGHFESVKNS